MSTPSSRIDGFAPIEDYAVLTDGRTSALLSFDGRIDWWPVPTLDGSPVFAALLDPDGGGYLSVTPTTDFEVIRRYVDGTNILECVYSTAEGKVRVTSSLNMAATGRLPWTELALRIEGLTGSVPMEWALRPSSNFRTAESNIGIEQGVPVLRVGSQTIVTLFDGNGDPQVSANEIITRFTAQVGDRALLAVIVTDGVPVFVPSFSTIDQRVDDTVDNWRRWSARIAAYGTWRNEVVRSALALKSLLAEYTGAIAAAATTSLPERLGGPKNWDYRFSWVRDASFVIDAFINLELSEEVHNAVAWLLKAVGRNGPDLHVFYTLSGELPGDEKYLDAPGYRDSQPVRAGNGAANQLQLGNYGDVFDTVHRYVQGGNVLDVQSQGLLRELADRCCEQWRRPDSGIWELHKAEHYTISKMGCWVALDRALKLQAMGQMGEGDALKWARERDEIRQFIEQKCWSESKQSYTFYADSDDLDAAILLSARIGFDVGARLASSIEAISRELQHGSTLYRYSGAEESEGAFVACTFWLVEALVGNGQHERASRLMQDAVGMVNDVGLLAEQISPVTGSFLGNMPQALSHLALINAAHAISAASQP